MAFPLIPSPLRERLRPLYLRTLHRWSCWLRRELPQDGERVDPRKASPLFDAHLALYFFARRFLHPGGHVLDLGCGAGYASEAFATVPGSSYLGVDLDPLALRFAEDHYGSARAQFRRVDLEPSRFQKLDPPLEPADLVVSSNCLEHLRDGLGLLPQLAPLVRPGGALVLAIPPSDGTPDENPFHFSEFPATRWRDALLPLFPRVRCFAHSGWGEPPEDQQFPEMPAEDLHAGTTVTTVVVAETVLL